MPRCGPPGGGTPTTTPTSRRGLPRPLPAGQVIGCAHRPTASSTPTPSAATSSSASLAPATTSRRIRPASPYRTPRRSPVMITTPTVSGKPGQAPTGLSCDLYPLIGSHSTWTDPRGPVRRPTQPGCDRPDRPSCGQAAGDLLPIRRPQPARWPPPRRRSDPATAHQIRTNRPSAQPKLPSCRLRRLTGPQPHPHLIDRRRRQPLVVAMPHHNLPDRVESRKCCVDPLRAPR